MTTHLPADRPLPCVTPPADPAALAATIKAAKAGDKAAQARACSWLIADPSLAPRFALRLPLMVLRVLVDGSFNFDGQPLARPALMAQVEEVRRAMAGENPGPTELLLAERISLNWLDLHRCEIQRESHQQPESVEHWDRRAGRAHKRLVDAIRALAAVRRLAAPRLQVNVGHQVNVAGG